MSADKKREPEQMKTEEMDSKELLKRFVRQLGFWFLHCVISALPGFFCAIFVLGQAGERNLADVVPMLVAIITFVILLAVLFTSLEAKAPMNVLVRKGMTAGLRIRMVMVVAGLLILAVSRSGSYEGLILIPDVWIGLLAAFTNHWVCTAFGTESGIENLANGGRGFGFGTIYALSLTVGSIIALLIFILSFLSTLFFQMRMRRGFMIRQEACPGQMGK